MGNAIQCIKRIYRIHTPTGVKMDIERDEPLSEAATAKLLEEDYGIKSFLEKCNILSVEISENAHINNSRHRSKKKTSLKRIRHKELEDTGKAREEHREDVNSEEQDIRPEKNPTIGDIIQSGNRPTPCDRINMMITMEGEFTRKDYQKFMEDKNYRMTDCSGYGDIEDALLLRKIELTGEKIGKGYRKYRMIDTRPVEQYMYRKTKKSHKEKSKCR